MNRKIMNDIIVSKKSIRQIPISTKKVLKSEKKSEVNNEKEHESNHFSHINHHTSWQRKPINPKFVIWFIAIICLLALFFGISIIFSSATIIITPRMEKISFENEIYIAKADSAGITELSFEVLKITQQAGDEVEATEEKEVSQKATGVIIIYNNYSSASQRLINNTRFEANNGKIYRINNSIAVPGIKKVDGKIVPGSIEAVVFADQAGESYNLKIADLDGDFKIPGFKGDPRYEAFYARLKEDISGGYIGKQRIVEDSLRKTTEESVKIKLKEQLLKELYAVKPENFLFFSDGYSIDYTKLPDTTIDKNKVKINMEGTINGIVFNNSKLANYLAGKKITEFDGLPTEFIISDNLATTFTGKDISALWKNDTLEIKFQGDAKIKWLYDGDMIRKDLAGKNGSDIINLITKYKNTLSSIEVLFKPVWTRYIPDNLNKIKIQEEII